MNLGDDDFVDLLIEYKANVNLADESGKAPLHIASSLGKSNFVKRFDE